MGDRGDPSRFLKGLFLGERDGLGDLDLLLGDLDLLLGERDLLGLRLDRLLGDLDFRLVGDRIFFDAGDLDLRLGERDFLRTGEGDLLLGEGDFFAGDFDLEPDLARPGDPDPSFSNLGGDGVRDLAFFFLTGLLDRE